MAAARGERHERDASARDLSMTSAKGSTVGPGDAWAIEDLSDARRIAAVSAAARAHLPLDDSSQDLEWLALTVSDPQKDLLVLTDSDGSTLTGLAPFRISRATVSVSAGPVTFYSARVQRYSMLREPLTVRSERRAALSACLQSLAETMTSRGAAYFEAVPQGTDLQHVLDDRSDSLRSRFYVMPWGPGYEHYKIKWDGKVDAYLQSLSSKNRYNMRRPAQKLASEKNLRTSLKRFQRPGEVDAFLDDGIKVSEKTYQSRKLGTGLSRGGSREKIMRFAAERGSFLGHVLYINDQPAAFQFALVHARTFYGIEMGYDPAWAQHHVGNVLFFRMLEDLEKAGDDINLIDMLTYDSVFKHRASNVRVPVQNYYLFPRSWAGRSIYWPLKGAMSLKALGLRLSDRLRLTARIKRFLREQEKTLDERQ